MLWCCIFQLQCCIIFVNSAIILSLCSLTAKTNMVIRCALYSFSGVSDFNCMLEFFASVLKGWIFTSLYGTAQLQGNICTCPVSGKKGYGTHVRITAALSQGFALAWTRLVRIPLAHFRCVRMLLGAELYRTLGMADVIFLRIWYVVSPHKPAFLEQIWKVTELQISQNYYTVLCDNIFTLPGCAHFLGDQDTLPHVLISGS